MEHRSRGERFRALWDQYKFVGLILLLGVVLLLWPSGDRKDAQENSRISAQESDSDGLAASEAEMTEILSKISGVGELQMMLTVESGAAEHFVQDGELTYSGATSAPDDYSRKSTTVVVSGENGDEPILINRSGPVYRGALIVCQGADRAEVKLAVTQAVAALTGLSSDRISVVKCQS